MLTPGHPTIGSNRLPEARAFYDTLLASAGVTKLFEHPSGGRAYGQNGRIVFVLLAPYNGQPASPGNGAMSTFSFDTTEEVDAFHALALSLGAIDEGAPGFRAPGYYMSYFRDLDGNKICAFKID